MSDNQSTVARFPVIGRHLVHHENPAYAETVPGERDWHAEFDASMAANLARPTERDAAPLTAADLADYNRQHMPAEAATHFGADMHNAYRPAAGWAVELAFATVVILFIGGFTVIGWLATL